MTIAPTLLVIGIDGAEWDVIDPMLERGQLPALARLLNRGTGVRLRSPKPLVSPPLWTTIATGKSPLEHGITWFLTNDADGHQIPATGAQRRVPAFWDIAGQNGLRVAVIGWWATWPAEPVSGVMVSDRLLSHGFALNESRPTSSLVYPEERTAEMLALIPNTGSFVPPELEGLLPPVADLSDVSRSAGDDGVLTPVELLRAASIEVEAHHQITLHLLNEGGFDLVCVYFEGVDTVSHVFMPSAEPAQEHVDPEFARTHNATVERFYAYQDRILGELIAAADPETAVMVVSDHGFRSGKKRLPQPTDIWTLKQAPRDHLEEGILVVSGPPFSSHRERLSGIHLNQFAPAVLRSLGLPLEDTAVDLVPEKIFKSDFLSANPQAIVTAYPARTPPPLPEADEGLEVETARLRALGYITTEDQANSGTLSSDIDEALHRAIYLHLAGRLTEAASVYESLVDRAGSDSRPAMGLARIRLEQGRLTEARAALATAMKQDGPQPAEVAELQGRLLVADGALFEAEKALRRSITLDPTSSRAREALVDLLFRQKRFDDAAEEVQAILTLDPRSAPTWRNLGVIQEAMGDLNAAESSYQESVAVEPDFAPALLALGIVAERRRDYQAAEAYYRAALDADPEDPTANTQLGVLLFNLKRPEEAVEPLRKAARLLPDLDLVHQALKRAEDATGG